MGCTLLALDLESHRRAREKSSLGDDVCNGTKDGSGTHGETPTNCRSFPEKTDLAINCSLNGERPVTRTDKSVLTALRNKHANRQPRTIDPHYLASKNYRVPARRNSLVPLLTFPGTSVLVFKVVVANHRQAVLANKFPRQHDLLANAIQRVLFILTQLTFLVPHPLDLHPQPRWELQRKRLTTLP